MKKFKENDKGFTLVELVIVIAIILVLAALLVPRIMGSIEDARRASEVADAKTIASEITTHNAIALAKGGSETFPAAEVGTDGFEETYISTAAEPGDGFKPLLEEDFTKSKFEKRDINFKYVKIWVNKDGSAEVHWMGSGDPISEVDEDTGSTPEDTGSTPG